MGGGFAAASLRVREMVRYARGGSRRIAGEQVYAESRNRKSLPWSDDPTAPGRQNPRSRLPSNF
jgi:hypothetical protein